MKSFKAVLAFALGACVLSQTGVRPLRASTNGVVIRQVYGGGGNSGATLKNDFIELFNGGTASVNLAGWSVQYASSAGTTWQVTALTSVSLAPGQYYLVQESAGTGGSVNLPTPDASGSIAMSATAGKVALVSSMAALSGSCPAGVVDVVGYGGSNCFEGSAAAPLLTNTTADLRKAAGCTDTDVNSADFSTGAPAPRNTASPLNACTASTNPSVTGVATPNAASVGDSVLFTATPVAGGNPPSTGLAVSIDLSAIGVSPAQTMFDDGSHGDATPNDGVFSLAAPIAPGTTAGLKTLTLTVTDAQSRSGSGSVSLTVLAPPTITPIHAIQGTGTTSTMAGLTVTTEGVVIGVKSNGFFIQLPDGEADLDANTSEGLFVFTSASGLPAATAVGNRVRVTGQVSEFKSTATDPDGLSATELTGPTVVVLSTGNPLPAPVTLTAAELNPGASTFTLEKYEGMRVHVAEVISTSPTEGNVVEANASSTSNGLFFAVVPGTPRPFREPGIQTPLPIPEEAAPGATPPIWDGNPERIGVDTDAIALTAAEAAAPPPAGTALNVTTGVTVDNVTGPLDYAFRSYLIDTERWNPPVAMTPNASLVPVRPRNDDEFTVATFNMERFFDTTNDPSVSDVQLTAAAFERRLSKASLAIRNVLLMPDVIGVEEMENLTTLQAVASRVNNDAILAGQGDPHYVAYLSEGNDVGGIDSGLLVRSDRIDVDSVTQYGKDTLFLEPGGGTALLNDRPPLVLRAHVRNDPFDPYAVTIIVNHMRSLSGVDGPDGLRIRTKRRVQAEYLATLIQSFQTVTAGHPIAERVISVGDYNAFDINDGYVDAIGTVKGTPTPASQVTQASPDLVDPDLLDLVSLAPAGERYSFTFDGNAQELDHLLVTTGPSNALLVNGINYARMNADFPEILRNDPNRPERISDHDPIVGYFSLPDLDLTPPTVTVPASFSLEGDTAGGAFVTYTATATDGVDGPIAPVCDHPAGSLFTVGATLVTCTAMDTHGNVATATFTITVTDTTAPTLSLPSLITVEATGPAGAAVTFSATAFDIVSGPLTPSCNAVSGATFPLGPATVTCVATDAAGNITSGSFGVNVVDTTPPELTVPAPIVIEATSASGATVAYAASALDLVDGSVTPSCGPPTGSTFAIGSTLATCTATDAHGNVSTRTFTVEVRDTTPPAIGSVSATPSVVWPPNKRMVPVVVVVSATDTVSAPACTLTGITGDDGSTSADWQITGALTALVRADRTGGGSGRTYTLAFICTDATGNAAGSSATVVVPHDRRK